MPEPPSGELTIGETVLILVGYVFIAVGGLRSISDLRIGLWIVAVGLLTLGAGLLKRRRRTTRRKERAG